MRYVDLVINAIFALDILVNMRTTYFDDEGEEVSSGIKIAERYMAGLLIFDIVVSIPWQEFIFLSTDIIKGLGILKVTRIP